MGMCGQEVEVPDYAEVAREGIYADIATLPYRKMIEAAAQKGEKIEIGGRTYDFTGLGEAEYAVQSSEKLAQALLDVQKQYGTSYVKQRLAELQQSDPEGQAARKTLYDGIMAELNQMPERPVAELAEQRILGRLQTAAGLSPAVIRDVQQGVRGGQVARGMYLGNAPASQEAQALASASETQQAARRAEATQWLQSGATPEDVAYRRSQQNMANLSAFMAGQTPTAQFSQLSGAQTSAAPFYGGPGSQTTLNPNAGLQSANYANSIYSANVNWAANQINPWVAGAGLGMNAYAAGLQNNWWG